MSLPAPATVAIDLFVHGSEEPYALEPDAVDQLIGMLAAIDGVAEVRSAVRGLVELSAMMRVRAGSPRLAAVLITVAESALPRLEDAGAAKREAAVGAAGGRRAKPRAPMFGSPQPAGTWRLGAQLALGPRRA